MLKFVEAISEKTLRSTVALTAARGRGKSAALGLALAAAVAFGSASHPHTLSPAHPHSHTPSPYTPSHHGTSSGHPHTISLPLLSTPSHPHTSPLTPSPHTTHLRRYSNIFVTSPSPENLQTVFQFLFRGFDALGYAEREDYDVVQSTNLDFNKAVVRVNIFHDHRQTVQVGGGEGGGGGGGREGRGGGRDLGRRPRRHLP